MKLANTVLMVRKNPCDIRNEGIGHYMQRIILVSLQTVKVKMRRKHFKRLTGIISGYRMISLFYFLHAFVN